MLVHLSPGVSSDKTIDALYAFTDCEVSLSPNSCVIQNDKPNFMGVKEILRISTDNTLNLLKQELEIRKRELEESWHLSSLEKIFIEERIYKDKGFEEAQNMDAAIAHIDKRLDPWKPKLKREITRDDILRLMEIKMARILKFNKFKADEHIKKIEEEIEEVKKNIKNIVQYTIQWFQYLKDKYGKGKERKTEIRSFENIVASKVIVKNEKLYLDRREGFVGTGLKKAEYISDCSDIDDIIIFRRDGTYFITKVSEKAFIGKNPLHVAVFKKRDKRTIYNVAYRDGKTGTTYIKRFYVSSITRDKEYNLTKGTKGSRIIYFTANSNGEAETIKVVLKPKPRIKKLIFEEDFSELAIKGRQAMGNILTKHDIHKISLKEKGVSTLGGRKIWFDKDVLRLNVEKRGSYLGEFSGEEKILVIYKNGQYQLYNYDLSTHFNKDIYLIEKYKPNTVFSVVYFDAEQSYYYIKRFEIEEVERKLIPFIGDNEDNQLIAINKEEQPELKVIFGGKNEDREDEIIDVQDHIGVKSWKAKGKRISNYEINRVEFIEHEPEKQETEEKIDSENVEEKTQPIEDIPFEIHRKKDDDDQQMSLF
ncbi:MAG: hypothetical protein CR987_00420 [Draconibacterium sp.]|nr:MAG: hypothetical protein CR987_00420 [Draconibacterium sp.]